MRFYIYAEVTPDELRLILRTLISVVLLLAVGPEALAWVQAI